MKCDPRAFARCPYNKTCITPEQTEFEEGSDCFLFNKKVLSNAITNGDYLRGMSDMELASFLHTITRACADRNCAACPIGESNCTVMLYWVKSKYEVM